MHMKLRCTMLPKVISQYQLGKVIVNFMRTEVGFILAALICASAAVTASPVKILYRVVAAACLASNAFLLLFTASFGSILSVSFRAGRHILYPGAHGRSGKSAAISFRRLLRACIDTPYSVTETHALPWEPIHASCYR